MFLPLGAGPGRKLFPTVTVALIAINVVIHFAMLPRVERDNERLGRAMYSLFEIQLTIRAATGGGERELLKLFGLRREDRSDEDFWRKFEAGRIASKDSEIWQDWSAAKQEVREAERAHVHWQWGSRKDAPSPVTAVTSAFMHADFWHLFGNMLFLWIVGANMEEVWGRRTFLLLYVLGIVGSNLATFLESPAAEAVPGYGASGAVAAVMGAFMVRHFKRPIRVWSIVPVPAIYSVPAFVLLPAWFFAELVALSQKDPSIPGGTAHGVHALGFVFGALVALALKAGGDEKVIEAPQEAQRRRLEKDALVAEVDRRTAANDTRGTLEALGRLLAFDPDEHPARARKMEMHAFLGDRAAARAEALELLERTWRSGQRAAYSALFARVDVLLAGAVPVGLVHRAAVALEASDPAGAAALYVRVAREGQGDPILPQSLKRYAALLTRVGEPEKAAQVQALLERLERIER